MLGPPTSFWAKLTFDSGDPSPSAWHPLADHCADVGACFEAILRETNLRRRLATLAGLDDLADVQIARLAVLATLHDLGKANIGFQNKALAPGPGRLVAGHVRVVMELLAAPGYEAHNQLLDALPSIDLSRWSDGPNGAATLLIAAISHHGKPVPVEGRPDGRIWQAARGLEPFEAIRELVARTRSWFPEAYETNGDSLPDNPAFQHAFNGVVMLADWLGSDSYRFFPFSESPDDRMPFARRRAVEALGWIGLAPRRVRISLGGQTPGFERISPFHPRPAQAALLDLPVSDRGSLTILEAETGAGKTEAALARYLRLFHSGQVDGLYFALPTRTAATQIHRRVHRALERAFPEGAGPPVVLAVPGYIAVDDRIGTRDDAEGRQLPHFEVLWPDDPEDRFRFRGWAAEHPKRYLAGGVVVGTIDQALLSALTVSHAHMRSSALLRLLLVVDEVHASDDYMTRLLEAVLDHHLAAGGHALLMSATLGTSAAHRFLATAGRLGQGKPSLETARTVSFPGITYRAVRGEPLRIATPGPLEGKVVRVALVQQMERSEAVAERALAGAESGARVLVIRNTVAACLETQIALETLARERGSEDLLFRCLGLPSPHHARYAREDRRLLDDAIEASFGEHRPDGGCAAIATQTVQQSLDLDADYLITDLCPMDVLLQRIGRLHRHHRKRRPPGFEDAAVDVLVPEERDLGSRIRRDGTASGSYGLGTVYQDLRVLEATWRRLTMDPRLVIPAMNRELVEVTTHPEALAALTEELGGLWTIHQQWLTGRFFADRRHAGLNLLDRTVSFGEARFPPADLERKVQTRLGENDRLARLKPMPLGPFGEAVGTLPIPAHLARDIPPETEPQVIATTTGSFRIRWSPREYVYDRLGLRAAVEPDEPEEPTDA